MELYSMDVGLAEANDLAGDTRYGSQAGLMASELERVRKKDRLLGKVRSEKPGISKERAEKLKALGYVQ
jgi:hypothetical protein